MSAFTELLGSLMSPDNAMRKNAEAYFFSQVDSNPILVAESLIQVLSDKSGDLTLRSFSGILLRRSLDQIGSKVSPEINNQLREAIIQIWSTETNKLILKRISHAIAQSSACGKWDDLIPRLLSMTGSLSQNGIIALLELIEIVSEYNASDIEKNLSAVGSFLSTLLGPSVDPHIQLACAKATGACIIAIEDDGARGLFKPALEPIIVILGSALQRGDEIGATSTIQKDPKY